MRSPLGWRLINQAPPRTWASWVPRDKPHMRAPYMRAIFNRQANIESTQRGRNRANKSSAPANIGGVGPSHAPPTCARFSIGTNIDRAVAANKSSTLTNRGGLGPCGGCAAAVRGPMRSPLELRLINQAPLRIWAAWVPARTALVAPPPPRESVLVGSRGSGLCGSIVPEFPAVFALK